MTNCFLIALENTRETPQIKERHDVLRQRDRISHNNLRVGDRDNNDCQTMAYNQSPWYS